MLERVDKILHADWSSTWFASPSSSISPSAYDERPAVNLARIADALHTAASKSSDHTTASTSSTTASDSEFKASLNEYAQLEEAIGDLSELSAYFPSGLCTPDQVDDILKSGDEMKHRRKPESLLASVAGASISSSPTSSGDVQKNLMRNYGFVGLWLNMQKTFCGVETPHPSIPQTITTTTGTRSTTTRRTTTTIKMTNTSSSLPSNDEANKKEGEEKGDDENTMTERFDALNLSKDQLKSLGLLFNVMYSNPVVLYAPNTTLVRDALISKANGTFELIDQINRFSRQWLNVSASLVAFMERPSTNRSLELLNAYRSTLVAAADDDDDETFTVNKTTSELTRRIRLVDSAACSWLQLMSPVNLDIFKGFASEHDLVAYFLEQAYVDNVTVLASLIFDLNGTRDADRLPPHLTYKIRQNASFTYTTKKIRER